MLNKLNELNMSLRNIVKIGGSYYIALPKKWVKEYNIDKVKLLNIQFRDDGILEIIPLNFGYHEQRLIKLIAGPLLKRKLVAAYLKGYEVIEVDIKEQDYKEILALIEDLQKILIGLEIVEESEKKIVVQCFTTNEYQLESLLYRMDSISRKMYIDAVTAYEKGDVNLAESVKRRDNSLDRIYFLTVRTIRTRIMNPLTSKNERLLLLDYRLLARDLEEIGDIGEEIAYLIGKEKTVCELGGIINEIAKYQHEIVKNILLNKGNRCGNECFEKFQYLRDTVTELRLAKDNCYEVLHKINNILQKIKDIQDLA